MWRATIKGLLAYKLRLALTGTAVVLGVAFVVGTFVLTDTIAGFFDSVFAEANSGTDVLITAQAQGGSIENSTALSTERIPAEVLATVEHTKGVAVAEGNVQGTAQIIDRKGKLYGGLGPPTLGFSYGVHKEFTPLSIREGMVPSGEREVAIDVVSARKLNYKVGDTVKIVPQGPAREFRIAALVGFGKADNLGGATIVAWDLPTAQKVLDKGSDYDAISIKADAGTAVDELIGRLDDALPDTLQVRSGQQAAADASSDVKEGIGVLTNAILFFAGIALFVGAFIIANTFSIIVAQRARELALLRSLGASRTQVMFSVLGEAAIVGFVSSIVGIVVGLGVGAGLRALVNAVGGGGALPGSAVGLKPRTIVVGMLIGTLTTLISAIVPAIRGSRQPPVTALRQTGMPAPARFSFRRVLIGVGASAFALVLLYIGLYGKSVPARFGVIGLGALGLFLAIAMLSPLAARPLARALGAPIAAAQGVTGRLARENAARNPQRTASTAAALMIGLAVVVTVATLGSSITKSINRTLDRTVKAQIIVNNRQGGIDPAVEQRMRAVRGVTAVVPLRYNQFVFNGKRRVLVATSPVGLDQIMDLEVARGVLADLADGGVLLHEDIASTLGLDVGDTMQVELPKGPRTLRVDAVFSNRQVTQANYVLSLIDYEQGYTDQSDNVIFAATAPGAAPAQVAAAIGANLQSDYPGLEVQDQAAFKKQQSSQIKQLLLIVNALLLLSILIALLGIANTLALSVFERTRELGLLRAVGMSRRQTRRMIRWESVIIAVIGAVLGVFVGLAFGFAAVRALRESGLTEFVVPAGTVIFVLMLAGVAGIIAAIFPARRAARLDVLQAIAAD